MLTLQSIPSIRDQAADNGWNLGFFGFGKAKLPNVDFFNCGLVRRDNFLWLIARRSTWEKGAEFGNNDVVAFRLKEKIPQFGSKVKMEQRFAGEHFEDPRAIMFGDKCYVSACDFTWSKKGWSGAHQIICEVDKDWKCIKRYDPVFGFNGSNLGQNKGHEKNWLWFVHDGQMHLLYKACPHEVISFDENFIAQTTYKSDWSADVWTYGEIRGGTPPIRIGNEYYTFAHSSTPWIGRKRQYHLLCYVFDAKPPFAVKRITPYPLLTGSSHDPWDIKKPACVFACGAEFSFDKFFITMGVNDLVCAWVEIPRNKLEERMIEI